MQMNGQLFCEKKHLFKFSKSYSISLQKLHSFEFCGEIMNEKGIHLHLFWNIDSRNTISSWNGISNLHSKILALSSSIRGENCLHLRGRRYPLFILHWVNYRKHIPKTIHYPRNIEHLFPPWFKNSKRYLGRCDELRIMSSRSGDSKKYSKKNKNNSLFSNEHIIDKSSLFKA